MTLNKKIFILLSSLVTIYIIIFLLFAIGTKVTFASHQHCPQPLFNNKVIIDSVDEFCFTQKQAEMAYRIFTVDSHQLLFSSPKFHFYLPFFTKRITIIKAVDKGYIIEARTIFNIK